MKSDGVEDVVKWMKEQLKLQKARVDEANRKHSSIATVGDFFDDCRREEDAKMAVMVSWMISTEKYMKRLRHQGE